MGNCGSATTKKKGQLPKNKSVLLTKQDLITMDIEQDLTFKIVIENIKIKNLPASQSTIHVQFGDQISHNFKEIKNDINPHWKVKEEFIMKIPSDKFKTQQFVLTVKSKNQAIGSIAIDLLKIATGPVHHDFLLNTHGGTDEARITFLLTMAQAIKMELTPKDVSIELNDEGLKYERLKTPMPFAYNFNFKVKAHDCDYESHHSYNFRSKHPQKNGYENQPKSTSNLHEDQDMFFKQTQTQTLSSANKNSLPSAFNFNQNATKKTETLEIQEEDEHKSLSEDEFCLNDIDEVPVVKTLARVKEAGTIEKVNSTLKSIQQKKEEKGKLYRNNSRRHQSFQNTQTGKASKFSITSQNHIQDNHPELQKQHSAIKVKSKRGSSIHKIQSFLTQKQQTISYANNNMSITRQLSSSILTTYDDVLDWFRIQHWDFTNKNEETPQLIVSIYADEFASSTFYIKLWSNYDTNLDPFKTPGGKIETIKSMHNFDSTNSGFIFIHNKELLKDNSFHHGKSMYKHRNHSRKDQKNSTKTAQQVQNEEIQHIQNMFPDDESSDSGASENYIDHDLVAHAELSMNRFCSEDYEIIISNFEKKLMIQVHHLKDLQLWHHGKCVGTCTGNFITSHKPFYRQMYGGVRTESGITKSTQIYLKKKHLDGKDSKIPVEFKQILNKHDVIEEAMEKLNTEDMPYRQRLRLNQDIQINLNKINELLKIHSFLNTDQLFKNEEQLFNAQQILIKIAKHLLEYAEQVDEVLRDVYYDVLTRIVNREELGLSHMGFDLDINEVNIRKLKNKAQIEKKISIGLTYQSFLYSTLDKVLMKLEQPGLNEKERQFVENFSSLAYFRIPQFRDHLLDAISQKHKQSNIKLPEWVDVDEEQQKQDIKFKYFLSMFTWEKDFYSYLKTSPRYADHINRLNSILEKNRWKQRFQKTGVAFFMFLASWSNYVQKNITSAQSNQNMPWEVLPGYNTLMKSFLFEMKIRDTEQFPDSFREASSMLLYNPIHLKPFLYIMYNKTNVYISRQVFYCYDIMNQWFQRFIHTGQKIPTNFDFTFFFKGIRIILDLDKCEHAVTIAKVLLILYHNYTLFPLDKKVNDIGKIVFSNRTFLFFAHWSRTVRNVFASLLMYRIYHQHRILSISDNKFDDYKQEKKHLELKLQKQKLNQQNPDFLNHEIFSQFIRLISYAKKSKRKILAYMQNTEVPIQKQLEENSLRVKLLKQRQKIQRLKTMNQNRKESEQSNFNDSTPKSKNTQKMFGSDKNIMLNTPSQQRPKYSSFVSGGVGGGQNSQANTNNTGNQLSTKQIESLPDSSFASLQLEDKYETDQDVQSMCMPTKKNYQDLMDISQQNLRRGSFSSESSLFSDEAQYQNLNRMEEDLQEEYGVSMKKREKKTRYSSVEKQPSEDVYLQYSPTLTRQKYGEDSVFSVKGNMARKFSYENSIKPKPRRKVKTNQKIIQSFSNQQGQKKKVYQGKLQQDLEQKQFQIPKKCYKMLVNAYEEFEEVQKEYEIWYEKQLAGIINDNKLSEEEKLEKLRDAPIPDIPIRIQKDEAESKNLHQADEW